jgi:Zn-dependent peptidase ImmA (M78 family)/transcriptional regulator with XRE-family HTH domain
MKVVLRMLTTAPGERVRMLRELLGLTQVKLANIAGIAQSWLSDVETGNREADQRQLGLIATATGTPISFFYAQSTAVPLDSLRFRKLASASKLTRRRIHAFYAESYRVAEDLLTYGNYPPATLPYASEQQLRATDVDYFAGLTRRALRLAPDKPIPHLTRALERAGIATAPIVLTDFDTGEIGSSGHHFGVSYWGGIGEPALIGYFPGEQGDRDRFTMAHELGHLVLHTYRPDSPDPEREANQFASAILIPKSRAVSDISERTTLTGYARLKATWGLSIQALIMRGADVGAISDTRKRSLFVQLSQYGWRKTEPVAVGQESPLLLWSLLSRRFGARPYLAAAETLAIHPVVLRSIAPTPSPGHKAPPPPQGVEQVVRLARRPRQDVAQIGHDACD